MENQNTNGNGYFKGNIDARVSSLEKNVETVLNNHLPHLQMGIDEINGKIDAVAVKVAAWAMGIIATILATLVVFHFK